ncbi:MAG: 4'-phosphopantetheinyl transferase superfamily protein [Lachnospiraceae bacterium]|nr:4'-phosphopantetheinyl transferase superfamily protein [Lachnospiraceae bacterium]
MDLYIGNINNFTIDELMPHVTDERAKVSLRFVHDDDKKRSLLAHALLNCAVCDRFPDITLPVNTVTDEQGKPHIYLPDGLKDPADERQEFHFSLSHSGEYAICAVDNDIIGADIEYIDNKPVSYNKIATRFFCRQEADDIKDTETFFRIWTLKESFTKAVGLGLGLPLNSFRIIDLNSHDKFCHFVLMTGQSIPDKLTPFIKTGSDILTLNGISLLFESHYALSLATLSKDPDITFHRIDDPVNLK